MDVDQADCTDNTINSDMTDMDVDQADCIDDSLALDHWRGPAMAWRGPAMASSRDMAGAGGSCESYSAQCTQILVPALLLSNGDHHDSFPPH